MYCLQTTSGVLFDGNIPTLTGLDGNTWANQLLTIHTRNPSMKMVFDFSDTPGYTGIQRVEVVIFNCQRWNISVNRIRLLGARSTTTNTMDIIGITKIDSGITSCNSPVRICMRHISSLPVLTLQFELTPGSSWVHLAEVSFYGSGSTCSSAAPTHHQTTEAPFEELRTHTSKDNIC